MATLGVTFAGAALSLGGKKAEDKSQPPINAKSKDEESFVKYALRNSGILCREHRANHTQGIRQEGRWQGGEALEQTEAGAVTLGAR
jgi:hypothetical protein